MTLQHSTLVLRRANRWLIQLLEQYIGESLERSLKDA